MIRRRRKKRNGIDAERERATKFMPQLTCHQHFSLPFTQRTNTCGIAASQASQCNYFVNIWKENIVYASRGTIRTVQNKGENVEWYYNREFRLNTMGTSPREEKGDAREGRGRGRE